MMTRPMSEPPRLFVIDTDTASDDAVALVMALRHPGVAVEVITVVAGNVPRRVCRTPATRWRCAEPPFPSTPAR